MKNVYFFFLIVFIYLGSNAKKNIELTESMDKGTAYVCDTAERFSTFSTSGFKISSDRSSIMHMFQEVDADKFKKYQDMNIRSTRYETELSLPRFVSIFELVPSRNKIFSGDNIYFRLDELETHDLKNCLRTSQNLLQLVGNMGVTLACVTYGILSLPVFFMPGYTLPNCDQEFFKTCTNFENIQTRLQFDTSDTNVLKVRSIVARSETIRQSSGKFVTSAATMKASKAIQCIKEIN